MRRCESGGQCLRASISMVNETEGEVPSLLGSSVSIRTAPMCTLRFSMLTIWKLGVALGAWCGAWCGVWCGAWCGAWCGVWCGARRYKNAKSEHCPAGAFDPNPGRDSSLNLGSFSSLPKKVFILPEVTKNGGTSALLKCFYFKILFPKPWISENFKNSPPMHRKLGP